MARNGELQLQKNEVNDGENGENQFQKSGCQENKANKKIKEEIENPKKAERSKYT